MTKTNIDLSSNEQLILIDSMTYDHSGRVKDHYYGINGEMNKICSYKYTIKDEVQQKMLGYHGNTPLQTLDYEYLANGFLTKINEPISAPYLPGSSCVSVPGGSIFSGEDIFYLELGYDAEINENITSEERYNGDISQQVWQTRGRPRMGYGYEYDYLNRLTKARYETIKSDGSIETGGVSNKYGVDITYRDKIGNIGHITRYGTDRDIDLCGTKKTIDHLSYTYYPNTSKIKDISDVGELKEEGYPAYQTGDADYVYDANGNMTYDPSRGVTIVYNHLNLPDSLLFDDGKLIVNTYDYSGSKLSEEVWMNRESQRLTMVFDSTRQVFDSLWVDNPRYGYRRDYIGNVELEEGVWQVVHHAEGRVVNQEAPVLYYMGDTIWADEPHATDHYYYAHDLFSESVIIGPGNVIFEANNSIKMEYPFDVLENTGIDFEARLGQGSVDTGLVWEYDIKDHLGNIRLSFADLNGDGNITVSEGVDNEILEEHHYYPFGAKHRGPWLQRKNLGFKNRYGFGGKEEIPFSGYRDFIARTYDPWLCRMLQIDPEAALMPAWSPYSFVFNNPVRYIDPDGRAPQDIIDLSNLTESEKKSYNNMINRLSKSKAFAYYYGRLVNSDNVYTIINSENHLGGEGSFNPRTGEVTINGLNSDFVAAQELFHAFQSDLGVYNKNDLSVEETEGDLMSSSVALSLGVISVGGAYNDEGIQFNFVDGNLDFNESVFSAEFDKTFSKVVDNRISYYKNSTPKSEWNSIFSYIQDNSGKSALGIKKVVQETRANSLNLVGPRLSNGDYY